MWAWSLSDPFSSGGNPSAAGLCCVSSSVRLLAQASLPVYERERRGREHQREAFSTSGCLHFQRKSNPWRGECQSCSVIYQLIIMCRQKRTKHAFIFQSAFVFILDSVCQFGISYNWQHHFRVIWKLCTDKISLNSWSPPPVKVGFFFLVESSLLKDVQSDTTGCYTFIAQTVNLLCAQ